MAANNQNSLKIHCYIYSCMKLEGQQCLVPVKIVDHWVTVVTMAIVLYGIFE